MKTKEELRDYLLENYVNVYGNLDIRYLDFSEFDGNVYIDNMKVKGNLSQRGHEVQGDLVQSNQEVQGSFLNENNKYGRFLVETPSTKLLKEITAEELEYLGYTLKGE